jgi:hypothetical protein
MNSAAMKSVSTELAKKNARACNQLSSENIKK